MTLPEPETPAEALLAKADNCMEMADAQHEMADKQNLAADKLEALAHALEADAAQMLGNEIMDPGRGRLKISIVESAEVSPLAASLYTAALMPRKRLQGEAHGSSVLTGRIVLEIRDLHIRGDVRRGALALARRFGVDATTVHRIIHRKLWAHI